LVESLFLFFIIHGLIYCTTGYECATMLPPWYIMQYGHSVGGINVLKIYGHQN